jgi:hypothetical protein
VLQQNPDSAYDLLAKRYGSTSSNTTSSGDSLDPMQVALLQKRYGGDSSSPAQTEEPHSFMGFLGNIPGSAGRTAMNLGQLLNPMTYANLANVARGGMEKVLPGMGAEQVPMFDAAVEAMKQRYGHPLETMYHDPVGSLVDIAGALSGVGGAMKGAAGVGTRLGTELPNIARAGAIASRSGEVANPLRLAAEGVMGTARMAGGVGRAGLGLIAGRGRATSDLWKAGNNMAENTMLDTTSKFNKPIGKIQQTTTSAMRGEISEMDTVRNLRTAMKMAKEKRMAEYQEPLREAIAQSGDRPLTQQFNRVRDDFYRQLDRFQIRRTGGASETPEEVLARRPEAPSAARGTPEYETYNREFQQWQGDLRTSADAASGAENAPRIDFKGSGVSSTDEAGAKILRMDELFREWQEKYPQPTAMDLDRLKRSLDRMYSPDSMARAIVQETKGNLRRELEASVPRYKEITAAYHDASDNIEQFEREFSLRKDSKGVSNSGATIRKLSNALNQNNDTRKRLLMGLEEVSPGLGDRMMAEVAGHHFQGAEPRGLIGSASGLGVLYALIKHNLSPGGAGLLTLTSPRFQGEGLTALKAIVNPVSKYAVRPFMEASSNPFVTSATRAAGGETGYTPTYRVDAEPANEPPQIAMPGKESTEVSVTMPDGSVHVYDRKTGAYLRSGK